MKAHRASLCAKRLSLEQGVKMDIWMSLTQLSNRSAFPLRDTFGFHLRGCLVNWLPIHDIKSAFGIYGKYTSIIVWYPLTRISKP